MKFFKRFFLFLLINTLVVLTISFFLSLFNIKPYISKYGLDIKSLAMFCFIWGMLGAFISLMLSRVLAKWMMGIKLVDENTQDQNLKFIFESIKKISMKAGLKHTPQVGIYDSKEVNAFATGPSRKKSLIALSTGLINNMSKDEILAICGHEISHISNGDMITMTFLQGIINAFVMFLARILAYLITSTNKEKNRSSFTQNYFLIYTFEIIFMILASIPLAFFSRKREFSADKNSAKLLGKDKMISALSSLKKYISIRDLKKEHPSIQSFKISNNSKKFLNLFSTHPSLDKRIERLKNL